MRSPCWEDRKIFTPGNGGSGRGSLGLRLSQRASSGGYGPAGSEKDIRIPSSVRGIHCSFSGGESAAQRLLAGGAEKNEIAYGVYDLLARTLGKLFANAYQSHGQRPILLCGGVASSLLLRELLAQRCSMPLHFGQSRYSSDNAVGIATLAWERREALGWS